MIKLKVCLITLLLGIAVAKEIYVVPEYYEHDVLNPVERAFMESDRLGEYVLERQRNPEQYYSERFKTNTRLSSQGDIRSTVNLGVLYFEGKGVRQNTGHAIKLLVEAADRNDALAQYNLGVIYYVAKPDLFNNLKKAQEWFGRSCDNGFGKACRYYRELD